VDYRLRKRLLGTLQRAVDRAAASATPALEASVAELATVGAGLAPPERRQGEAPSPSERAQRAGQALPLQKLAHRLAEEWTDGRVKLYLTWQTLRFRREHPGLFQHGAYLPLTVAGPLEEHLIAFVRELDDDQIVVAVPRLTARLLAEAPESTQAGPLRFRHGAWDDTTLLLPDRPGRRYRSLFTGEVVETVEAQAGTLRGARSTLPLGTLLADFPVILLVRETP
jgi:maltooligosyltrehalose synthase